VDGAAAIGESVWVASSVEPVTSSVGPAGPSAQVTVVTVTVQPTQTEAALVGVDTETTSSKKCGQYLTAVPPNGDHREDHHGGRGHKKVRVVLLSMIVRSLTVAKRKVKKNKTQF
jgi:hypothetical protein